MSELKPWQQPLEWRRGRNFNCDHPLLDAVLQVRRRAAGDLTPGYRSGNEGDAYDQGVLDCYHAIERVMFGFSALDWTMPPRSPVADHPTYFAQGMSAGTAETGTGSGLQPARPVAASDAPKGGTA